MELIPNVDSPGAMSRNGVLVSLRWDPGFASLTSIPWDSDAGEVKATLGET